MSVFEQMQTIEIQQIKKENNQLRRMVQTLLRNSLELEQEFDVSQNLDGNSIVHRLCPADSIVDHNQFH